MKQLFIVFYFFFCGFLSAQEKVHTIFCNEYQNVALIMPSPIHQAVTGSDNFQFSYNRTSADTLGLIQGIPGRDSNLMIRTTDGRLYTYRLKYKDSLSTYYHFISGEERVYNENEYLKEPAKDEIQNALIRPDSTEYFRSLSNYFLGRNRGRVAKTTRQNITLSVNSIDHYKGNVYIVYTMKNSSLIDFEINFLELFKNQGTKGRKSSFQKLVIDPVYSLNVQDKVLKGKSNRFLMVYPRFTLGSNEKLMITLSEARGSRFIDLNIKRY